MIHPRYAEGFWIPYPNVGAHCRPDRCVLAHGSHEIPKYRGEEKREHVRWKWMSPDFQPLTLPVLRPVLVVNSRDIQAGQLAETLKLSFVERVLDHQSVELADIQRIKVDFSAKAPGAAVSVDDIQYITGRMEVCPASRNVKPGPEINTTLKFV